jgi:acyl-coenzyme A thioesterase PaaI-like protein
MPPSDPTPKIGTRQFERLVSREMDSRKGYPFRVEEIGFGFARLRLEVDRSRTRGGLALAGPVLYTLADSALFAAVLSVVGPEPRAFTTDMSIHFLRRPPGGDMIAEARLQKVSGQLLVGSISIWSRNVDEPVAQATGSYAVPERGCPESADSAAEM